MHWPPRGTVENVEVVLVVRTPDGVFHRSHPDIAHLRETVRGLERGHPGFPRLATRVLPGWLHRWLASK